jgi:hypothetical protein
MNDTERVIENMVKMEELISLLRWRTDGRRS